MFVFPVASPFRLRVLIISTCHFQSPPRRTQRLVSHSTLTCLLHLKGYEIYPAGATFGKSSNRGPQPQRKLRLPRIRFPPHPQWRGVRASKLYAEAQETNGAAAEAQRRVPPPPFWTCGSGDQLDQPDPTWLGELLRGWARQRVLWLHSRLGRKKIRRHLMRARKRKGFGWTRTGCTKP